MTWLRQVQHVAWKDLRHSRWFACMYVGVVILATLRAMALPFSSNGPITSVMVLVVLMGIIGTAFLVQSDSPTRSDAFWASRPFDRGAMVAAKIAVLSLLLFLAVLGQAIALRSAFKIALANVIPMAWESAAIYALWLLAASLVAALTRDLRTFILTFVGVLLIIFIVASFATIRIALVLSAAQHLVTLAMIVLSVALLAYFYQARRPAVRSWVAAVVLVAGMIGVIVFAGPPEAIPASPPPSIATGLRLEILNVNNLATDILRTHQINVRLAVDSAPASLSAVFTADTAVARLRDGTVLVLPVTMGATLRIPDPPLEAPVRWLGAPLNSLTMDRIGVPLHGNTVSAVARGLVSLEIQGRLSLMRPRVFARVPLREGEQINSDGMRVRIARVAHELGQTSVELETASVGDPGGGIRARAQSFFGGVDRPSYVMLNPGRGEAVALFNRNSGGGTDWLVLPGTSIRQSTMRLQPNDAPGLNGQFAPDDAWYGNAQLLIVEWTPAGEYRARVSAQVH